MMGRISGKGIEINNSWEHKRRKRKHNQQSLYRGIPKVVCDGKEKGSGSQKGSSRRWIGERTQISELFGLVHTQGESLSVSPGLSNVSLLSLTFPV